VCHRSYQKRKEEKQETTSKLDKKEDTQELEQMITNLKVQIEEDKRIEETLKEQLEEKDRIIGNLEAEIVTLRKDLQKKNMQNNSKVLDDIINSQKPHHDKLDLDTIRQKRDQDLQNNRARNISKNLCRNNQRGYEDLQGRLQGHSSTEKIHISESTTDR
jgi:hypothetical protein